jgi:outer membrane protein OmpA-like peptidoglycan-associated protein
MSAHHKTRKISLTFVIVAVGLALPAGLGTGLAAEQPSTDQIIRALKPVTRSVSPADAARRAEETSFVNSLRNRPTRSLTTAEREQITSIAQKRPSVDLEVNFEYNSDNISSKATPQVTALGQALSSAELKGGTFIVAGHTDAKGGETYNQGLSERRAEAVKRFLSEKYGIDASNLVTVGYGKTQLKNPSGPLSSENRRVQVINASDK